VIYIEVEYEKIEGLILIEATSPIIKIICEKLGFKNFI